MDTAVTIRAASLDDYGLLHDVMIDTLDVHCSALPQVFRPTETPPPSREFIADLLEGNNGALLVAEHDDTLIGFLTIRMAQAPDHPYLAPRRYGLIDTMGISPQWRRQGIGRALIEAAHAWARDKGLPRVQLTVWEFNQEAIAFYESLGYGTAMRTMWAPL